MNCFQQLPRDTSYKFKAVERWRRLYPCYYEVREKKCVHCRRPDCLQKNVFKREHGVYSRVNIE